MAIESIELQLANGAPITIETGKIALLANASVTVTQGETTVLVAVCSGGVRPGMDFFPLQVSYKEKYTAAGRFPGGYIKREGRPSEKEILIARMTDRPIRPLFPKGFYNETQVQCLVLAADGVHDPDVLAMLGASAALRLSDLPIKDTFGALRVGRVDGEFVANPTTEEMAKSDLELIYAGVKDKCIMIEGDCDELTEDELHAGLVFANEQVKVQVDALTAFNEKAGKAVVERELTVVSDEAIATIKSNVEQSSLDEACLVIDKNARGEALDKVFAAIVEKLGELEEEQEEELKSAFNKVTELNIRRLIIEEGKRSDGRGVADLRPISAEVDLYPRTHGSALFARGETQGVVIAALGNSDDAQSFESAIHGEYKKSFYLHYNFPNYSVGECGRIMGPGNREIGHGNLAERSVAKMMPKDYPYTVRCVSEIMGSNGSTSMASICGASLALFAAGVPLKKQVAGISCGLVTEGDDYVLITDILGSEDHYGDMDFKVAGTRDGITGFQLDLKIPGISLEKMAEAMQRNHTARMSILDTMDACIDGPREEISTHAPQIKSVKINPEKIGALIGPGGKVIKGIVEQTGAKIDIEDSGKVNVFANNGDSMKAALAEIDKICFEPEVGKIYQAVVVGIKEFGAFVDIHGQSGLLHISEMADYRVEKVEDICAMGDKVTVKVMDIDNRGRISFSRKAALAELED